MAHDSNRRGRREGAYQYLVGDASAATIDDLATLVIGLPGIVELSVLIPADCQSPFLPQMGW
jgi:hypothetical protein